MKSCDCPRFDKCNAPVCPLDPTPTVMLSGEKVCHYLLVSGKEGAGERYKEDATFAAVLEQIPRVVREYPLIGPAIARAAKSGFRGEKTWLNVEKGTATPK